MPSQEDRRAELIAATEQEMDRAASLFDAIRSRRGGEPVDSYTSSTNSSFGGSLVTRYFISPYVILPARTVEAGTGEKKIRKVGIQVYLGYLTGRGIRTLPGKTPRPDVVSFNGRPIPLEAEGEEVRSRGGLLQGKMTNGNEISLLSWVDLASLADYPRLGSVGARHEWEDWQVLRDYPAEALRPAMAKYHADKLAGVASMRGTVEKALRNNTLNPR